MQAHVYALVVIVGVPDTILFYHQQEHVHCTQCTGWATNRVGSAEGSRLSPRANMRGGTMCTNVGQNVFENDGRPGTRGGGTMFDLEG